MALGSLVSTKLQDLIWDGLTVKTVPLTTNPFIFRKGTLDPFLYGPSQGFLDARKKPLEKKKVAACSAILLRQPSLQHFSR